MSFAMLQNEMRRQAMAAMAGTGRSRLGTCTSYDPTTYSAKVRLEPEGVETGWLPIQTAWAGNGWGEYAPPSPGDQVRVAYQEGSGEAGIIVGALYSDEDKPLAVPAGERWLVHKDGGLLKLKSGGEVEIAAGAGLTINVTGDITMAVSGDVTASANSFALTGDTTITGDLHVSGDLSNDGQADLGGSSGSPVKTDAGTATKVKAT